MKNIKVYNIDNKQNKKRGGVHQLLPGFIDGDAISNEAVEIQRIIQSWGYESKIFTINKHTSPMVRHLCLDYTEHEKISNSGNVIIYHHSIGSVLTQYFKNLPDKKILIYHNITPDKYFRNINTEKATVLHQGRKQLEDLAGVPDISLADSQYNCQELIDLGYKNTHVLPIILNFKKLAEAPKKKILNKYRDKLLNFLFVGRITPNKKIEDVIKVFYYFKETVNISSRLFIVGSFVGMERYYDYLRALTLELNLTNVVFTGHVALPELLAYYKLADVFVCMSEHEGFCIPLVESMYFGIPIVAYRAAAVPYTLGKSGILVDEKDYSKIAELIDVMFTQNGLRQKVIQNQKKRLLDYDISKLEKAFKSHLEGILI